MPLLDHRSPIPKTVYIDYDATDLDLVQLPKLTYSSQIEELRIDTRHVTGAGFAPITGLKNLKRLRLGRETATDEVLVYVAALRNLEEIYLYPFTAIKGPGLRNLVCLAKLRHLDLSLSQLEEGEGLGSLKILPNFEELDLSHIDINQSIMDGICQLTRLKKLQAFNARPAQAVAAGCITALTNLEELNVSGTCAPEAELTRLILPHLSGHQKLRKLNATLGQSSLHLLDTIVAIPNLEELTLGSSPIGDVGLDKLAALKNLKKLWLAVGCCVSHAGLERLSQALPGIEAPMPEIDYSP
jgi:hypothetical protein